MDLYVVSRSSKCCAPADGPYIHSIDIIVYVLCVCSFIFITGLNKL